MYIILHIYDHIDYVYYKLSVLNFIKYNVYNFWLKPHIILVTLNTRQYYVELRYRKLQNGYK